MSGLTVVNEETNISLSSMKDWESIDIKTTANPAVHKFCIQNNYGLKFIAANLNISLEAALLLFRKTENDNVDPRNYSSDIRLELLRNPVVYNNLDLFKLIFEKAYNESHAAAVTAVRDVTAVAPISILMFLLPTIVLSFSNGNYANIIKSRSDEVIAWAVNDNPELTGLPLSWVLRAYDFDLSYNVFDRFMDSVKSKPSFPDVG